MTSSTHSFSYELEVFDDIIYGRFHPDELSKNQMIHYLEEFSPELHFTTLIQFAGPLRSFKVLRTATYPEDFPAERGSKSPLIELDSTKLSKREQSILQSQRIDSKNARRVLKSTNTLCIEHKVNAYELSAEQLTLAFYTKLLNQHFRELTREIKHSVFQRKKPEGIEHYIQKLQHELNKQSEAIRKTYDLQLKDLALLASESYNHKQLFAFVLYRLQSILRFLEKNYYDYLNKSEKMPHKSALLETYHLRIKALESAKNMKKHSIDKTLIELLSIAMTDSSLASLGSRPTYQKMEYLDIVLTEFQALLQAQSVDCNDIIRFIVEHNFNHPKAFDFLTKYCRNSVYAKGNEQVYKKLVDHLRFIEQIPVRKNLCFDTEYDDLKSTLIHWLSVEIDSLTAMNLNLEHCSSDKYSHKLSTDLSVGQLALLLRLMSESGIISTHNQQEILRTFAQIIRTKTTDSISLKNLQNKFYQHDQKTIQEVRFKLLEMLNLIQNK